MQEEFPCRIRSTALDSGALLHFNGRAIQKPYSEYEDDFDVRLQSELYHADSMPSVDSLRYVTLGREVAGEASHRMSCYGTARPRAWVSE